MTDWFGRRRDERFVFRRVKWPSWEEAEEYGQITGGTVELSAFSDLKATGTLDFKGRTVPDDHDLIRIYYEFDDDGVSHSVSPIATLSADCGDPTFNGKTVKGSMKCYSVLQILAEKKYGMPFTVAAGTQVVQLAIQLTESLGLRVNNPDPSAYTVKSDYTFDPDASYLTIVNWLLSAAGYASCWPDAYGIVQMGAYVEPTKRDPMITFVDDDQSIMRPELVKKNDYKSTPNACRLYYETEEESLWAVTRNIDPDSKSSVVSRGRENTMQETVSELAGGTQAERLANLEAQSRTKLVDNSSDIEYVTISHAWVPIIPNDAVSIEYREAGVSWSGAVTNMKINLKTAVPCQMEARSFVKGAIETETEGGIL